MNLNAFMVQIVVTEIFSGGSSLSQCLSDKANGLNYFNFKVVFFSPLIGRSI